MIPDGHILTHRTGRTLPRGAVTGRPPLFESFCGDKEPQTLALLREYVFKGFGEVYTSQADGEENFGPTLTAPHGNVRKVRFKNRVIPDLNANKVNDMAPTWERIVLPRGWIMRETWLFLNNTHQRVFIFTEGSAHWCSTSQTLSCRSVSITPKEG